MKQFNLIFLKNHKMLLSRKQYIDWREIQAEYEDYMSSLDFESLDEVREFMEFEYKLTPDDAKEISNKINETINDTIKIGKWVKKNLIERNE